MSPQSALLLIGVLLVGGFAALGPRSCCANQNCTTLTLQYTGLIKLPDSNKTANYSLWSEACGDCLTLEEERALGREATYCASRVKTQWTTPTCQTQPTPTPRQ